MEFVPVVVKACAVVLDGVLSPARAAANASEAVERDRARARVRPEAMDALALQARRWELRRRARS